VTDNRRNTFINFDRPVDTPDYREPAPAKWSPPQTIAFALCCTLALWAVLILGILYVTGVIE